MQRFAQKFPHPAVRIQGNNTLGENAQLYVSRRRERERTAWSQLTSNTQQQRSMKRFSMFHLVLLLLALTTSSSKLL